MKVRVIGAGLAGVEAAYYLLRRGYQVELFEMRHKVMTPAHRTGDFAELVCSNSLRSDDIHNGVGLLKHEMRQFDSITMKAAEVAQVPAGSSLAVDRSIFSDTIYQTLNSFENVVIVNDVYQKIDDQVPTIIATGPLTHNDLMTSLGELFDQSFLHFFDAVAPIVGLAGCCTVVDTIDVYVFDSLALACMPLDQRHVTSTSRNNHVAHCHSNTAWDKLNLPRLQ